MPRYFLNCSLLSLFLPSLKNFLPSSLLFELSLYSLSSWRNMSGQGTERTVIFKSLTLEDTLYPLSWHTFFFFFLNNIFFLSFENSDANSSALMLLVFVSNLTNENDISLWLCFALLGLLVRVGLFSCLCCDGFLVFKCQTGSEWKVRTR